MLFYCISFFQGHMDAVLCLQFDKRRIITGSADRTVRQVQPGSSHRVLINEWCLHFLNTNLYYFQPKNSESQFKKCNNSLLPSVYSIQFLIASSLVLIIFAMFFILFSALSSEERFVCYSLVNFLYYLPIHVHFLDNYTLQLTLFKDEFI